MDDRDTLIAAGCGVLAGEAGREAIIEAVDTHFALRALWSSSRLQQSRESREERHAYGRARARHTAARQRCARLLAAPRGWSLARTPFSAPKLARPGRPGSYVSERNGTLVDHPECFRWLGRGWKPGAAILSHSYTANIEKHRAYATSLGLQVEPLAFSWYLPGSTFAVLYTRAH